MDRAGLTERQRLIFLRCEQGYSIKEVAQEWGHYREVCLQNPAAGAGCDIRLHKDRGVGFVRQTRRTTLFQNIDFA